MSEIEDLFPMLFLSSFLTFSDFWFVDFWYVDFCYVDILRAKFLSDTKSNVKVSGHLCCSKQTKLDCFMAISCHFKYLRNRDINRRCKWLIFVVTTKPTGAICRRNKLKKDIFLFVFVAHKSLLCYYCFLSLLLEYGAVVCIYLYLLNSSSKFVEILWRCQLNTIKKNEWMVFVSHFKRTKWFFKALEIFRWTIWDKIKVSHRTAIHLHVGKCMTYK